MPSHAALAESMKNSPLFHEIEPHFYRNVLRCLRADIRNYVRSEQIHAVGDHMKAAGLVLDGAVDVILFNEAGNQLSINRVEKGDLFGESFACMPSKNCPVSVHAVTDCSIVFLNVSLLFTPQKFRCPHAGKVVENLVKILAQKNMFLNQKVQILAQKKIRDKIKISLQTEMAKQHEGSHRYVIRFNRDEMANYLGVDRSALSRELCHLRDEGILLFQGNQIEVLDSSFFEAAEKSD